MAGKRIPAFAIAAAARAGRPRKRAMDGTTNPSIPANSVATLSRVLPSTAAGWLMILPLKDFRNLSA